MYIQFYTYLYDTLCCTYLRYYFDLRSKPKNKLSNANAPFYQYSTLVPSSLMSHEKVKEILLYFTKLTKSTAFKG